MSKVPIRASGGSPPRWWCFSMFSVDGLAARGDGVRSNLAAELVRPQLCDNEAQVHYAQRILDRKFSKTSSCEEAREVSNGK